jgi:predicted nucleic acid-binding protein
MLLLDASVWVASKDADDRFFAAARSLVLDPRAQVAALDLTLYEVANAIGARRGRRDAALELCRAIDARCGERIVRVGAGLIDSAIQIAAEHRLTAHDAAYVAAARERDWTLVSADIADLVSRGLAVAPDEADYP